MVYPSRLIYYLNRDSESPHHDLDTRVRNQAADNQVKFAATGQSTVMFVCVWLVEWNTVQSQNPQTRTPINVPFGAVMLLQLGFAALSLTKPRWPFQQDNR